MQRIGSKGPMGDFAKALCAHLTPQLLTTQHLEQLLRVVQLEDAVPEEEFLKAALRLLADSAQAAPRMFAGLEPQVWMLLHLTSSLLLECNFNQSLVEKAVVALRPRGSLLQQLSASTSCETGEVATLCVHGFLADLQGISAVYRCWSCWEALIRS